VPELPEVEMVVRTLRRQLRGKYVVGVTRGRQPLRRLWPPQRDAVLATPRQVQQVSRRGKWILLDLADDWVLRFHLGMTGRLRVVPADCALEPHTHLVLGLAPGRQELRFRDVRRFGSAELFTRSELVAVWTRERLGPEPFALTCEQLHASLRRSRRCLKALLLDQTVLAGLGNIYADESLFEAGLHPGRRGDSLRRAEAERLRQAIVTVIRRAIAKHGSTIRDFVFGEDARGRYQNEFRVYQRSGQPCCRCGRTLRRLRIAGRSTHYCPGCQPAPRARPTPVGA
jgi:formamidopyrimidine-DNA glycosylase